jgi:hypothetical protein
VSYNTCEFCTANWRKFTFLFNSFYVTNRKEYHMLMLCSVHNCKCKIVHIVFCALINVCNVFCGWPQSVLAVHVEFVLIGNQECYYLGSMIDLN